MNEINESLAHTTYECKYYVVFILKCRRKVLYREIRCHLGEMFRELARRRESRVEEEHLMVDHVHMLLSIPPKLAVSQVLGYIKGKSANHIARTFLGRRQNFEGQHFWARGYWVSTIRRDEKAVREYIRNQEKEDQRLDQLELFREGTPL